MSITEIKDVAPLLGSHNIDGKREYHPAKNHSGAKAPLSKRELDELRVQRWMSDML
jgi:hypothetical protein